MEEKLFVLVGKEQQWNWGGGLSATERFFL